MLSQGKEKKKSLLQDKVNTFVIHVLPDKIFDLLGHTREKVQLARDRDSF